MEAEQFERYLKRGGRSQSAVARCTMYVTEFENYLRTSRNDIALEEAEPEDLIEFVKSLDREKKTKSKVYLWAIRHYYTFEDNPELSNLAGLLREERIERKPFLLKGFKGVNQVYVDALAEHDIRNIRPDVGRWCNQASTQRPCRTNGYPTRKYLRNCEVVRSCTDTRCEGNKG